MNKLLSDDLWPTIARLARTATKRAAIAYVSSDEHICFTDGDLLVCDASPGAIKSAQTNAKVLKRAFDDPLRFDDFFYQIGPLANSCDLPWSQRFNGLVHKVGRLVM